MVEEHVGKRRRKEVRQAIKMKKELRSSLLVIFFILIIGIAAIAAMVYLLVTGVVPGDNPSTQIILLLLVAVVFVFTGARAIKLRNLYDDYLEHLSRFNISKDDMDTLQREES